MIKKKKRKRKTVVVKRYPQFHKSLGKSSIERDWPVPLFTSPHHGIDCC